MGDYLRTCRLCSKTAWADDMVKYGVRQYAHFACFVAHKNVADYQRLSVAQRERFEEWFKAKHQTIQKVLAAEANRD